jgi:hypothetical protein
MIKWIGVVIFGFLTGFAVYGVFVTAGRPIGVLWLAALMIFADKLRLCCSAILQEAS